MFKIEVVADTPEQMAVKLAGLSDIYKEGARCQKNPKETTNDTPAETTDAASKRRGRGKAKSKEPEVEVVETETVETPKEQEPEPEVAEKPLTLDAVREAMKSFIDAAAVKSGKEETRRVEFKALLDEFKAPKLSALPEDKWPEMVALAKKKLAEIS